jgi:hypothetical protein
MTDLSVRFEEPKVGGLTGQQLSLLREIQEQNMRDLGDDYLCEHQFFAASQQGPAEYCSNEAEPWSSYCSDHIPYEPDWDQIGKDQRNGFDD